MTSKSSAGISELFNPGNRGMTFITCFFLATGIWLLNTLSKNYTSTYSIELENQLQLSGDEFHTIHATINGRGFDLIRLHYRFNTTHQFNELKNEKLNTRELVSKIVGNLNPSVQIISVDPEFMSTSQSGLAHKRVPVKSKLEITYQKQVTASAPIMLKPDSIDISGALTDIEHVMFVEMVPMKLSNVSKPVFCSVALETEPLKNIYLSQSKVWLYVPVERYTEGSVIIPVAIINKNRTPVKLLPEKVTVTFRIPLSKYNLVYPSLFKAGVYITNFSSSNKTPVELLEKPSFVNGVSVSPSEVTYLIFD